MKQISRTQVLNWLNNNVGSQHITMDFKGRSLGAQCVGLTNAYSRFLGLPTIPCWRAGESYANADGRYYQRIKNGLTVVPKPGDIVVWDDHIAVIRDASLKSFVSLDQNWVNSGPMGSPASFVKHNWLRPRVIGFLRPVNVVDKVNRVEVKAPTPSEPKKVNVAQYYNIKKNDTFWALENAWRLPHGTLQKLNPKIDPKKLQIGSKIRKS